MLLVVGTGHFPVCGKLRGQVHALHATCPSFSPGAGNGTPSARDPGEPLPLRGENTG